MTPDRPPHLRLVPESVDPRATTHQRTDQPDERANESFAGPEAHPVEPGLGYTPDELFDVLATGIRGTAVDWSPESVARLQAGLLDRFGRDLGSDPEAVVARLVILARNPAAA